MLTARGEIQDLSINWKGMKFKMEKEELIEKVKVLLIYGKRLVDGKSKDVVEERIEKDKDDNLLAHYFYMKEFLKENLKDEKELQDVAIEKYDVNSIFFELQKLGHIVFAENTSTPKYNSGIFYMPKSISEKQRKALKSVQQQLAKENYNITLLMNLDRNEDGLIGMQKQGKADVLKDFTEEIER